MTNPGSVAPSPVAVEAARRAFRETVQARVTGLGQYIRPRLVTVQDEEAGIDVAILAYLAIDFPQGAPASGTPEQEIRLGDLPSVNLRNGVTFTYCPECGTEAGPNASRASAPSLRGESPAAPLSPSSSHAGAPGLTERDLLLAQEDLAKAEEVIASLKRQLSLATGETIIEIDEQGKVHPPEARAYLAGWRSVPRDYRDEIPEPCPKCGRRHTLIERCGAALAERPASHPPVSEEKHGKLLADIDSALRREGERLG